MKYCQSWFIQLKYSDNFKCFQTTKFLQIPARKKSAKARILGLCLGIPFCCREQPPELLYPTNRTGNGNDRHNAKKHQVVVFTVQQVVDTSLSGEISLSTFVVSVSFTNISGGSFELSWMITLYAVAPYYLWLYDYWRTWVEEWHFQVQTIFPASEFAS